MYINLKLKTLMFWPVSRLVSICNLRATCGQSVSNLRLSVGNLWEICEQYFRVTTDLGWFQFTICEQSKGNPWAIHRQSLGNLKANFWPSLGKYLGITGSTEITFA